MKWVVFEGIDGVGKTSQARAYAAFARDRYRRPVRYANVFHTDVGRVVKDAFLHTPDLSPETEILLLAAARARYVQQIVGGSVLRRGFLITDRFFWSITAMQGMEPGVSKQLLPCIQTAACGHHRPDLTLLLDADPETCRIRLKRAGLTDRIESKPLEFHARVRRAFLEIAAQDPRALVIDARPGFEVVQQRIRNALHTRLFGAGGRDDHDYAV